jgi:hypothetical protein
VKSPFILVVFIFLTCLNSSGDESSYKKIRDTRGSEYLLRAVELFPEIPMNSIGNQIDFVCFLEKRADLIQKTNSLITAEDRSRNLQTIRIETGEAKLNQQKVFDLEAIGATSVDEINSIETLLLTNLKSLLNLSNGETLRIALANLLKNHPEKNSLLKLPDEQLLTELDQKSHFSAPLFTELLARKKLENEVVARLIQILRAKNLKSIPEKQLRPAIRDVLQSFPEYKYQHSLALRMLTTLTTEALRTAAVTIENTALSRREGLVLFELPADLALIKGLLARDCSSKTCMGYPMSAKERVFLAVDLASKAPLGIVVGSMVNRPENPDFYLHTVNGLRLTSFHTDLILKGFFKSRQHLGFSKLLLPPPDKIDENVNFSEIANVLRNYSTGRMDEPIDFIDATLRHVIETFSTHAYDSMAENSIGRSIQPTANPTLHISVQDGSPYAGEPQGIQQLDSKNFRTLLLALTVSGAAEPAQELARLIGFDYSSLAPIISALNNTQGISVREYRKQRELILDRENPAARKVLLDFQPGALLAPDAFTVENFDLIAPILVGRVHQIFHLENDPALLDSLERMDTTFKLKLVKYIVSSLEEFDSPSTQEEFQILAQRTGLLQKVIPFAEWIELIDKLIADDMSLSKWLAFAFGYADSVSQDIFNAVADRINGKSGFAELIKLGQKRLEEEARLASTSNQKELAEMEMQDWSSQILSLALNMAIEKKLTPGEMNEMATMLHLPAAQAIIPYFPYLVPHLDIPSLESHLNSPQTIRTEASNEILLNLALISLSANKNPTIGFKDVKGRLFRLFIATPSLSAPLMNSASDLRSSADFQAWIELHWSRMQLLPHFNERVVMNSLSMVPDDKFVSWVRELLGRVWILAERV